MNNLTNTAKKLDKVFEIVHIVLGALVVASLAITGLIALARIMNWDPEFIGTGYSNFDIGFLELTLAPEHAPDKWLVLGQAALTLIVSCRLFWDGRKGVGYIREILKPMTEEKPFDSIVSTNLKKLANLSINLGILWNIITLADQIIAIFVFDIPGLMISDKISHVAGMFTIDLAFIVYWAILMLLSYVFRYGEQLQQLSDETL